MALTLTDPQLIGSYVERYNTVRLHSGIGFVTPADMLTGRQNEIRAVEEMTLCWGKTAATSCSKLEVALLTPGGGR